MMLIALFLATFCATTNGGAADSTTGSPDVFHHAPPGSPLEFHAPPPMWQVRTHMPALRDTIGADVEGVADSLRCRIEPFCSHVWPNTNVRFRVRVANRSRRAIYLVRPPATGSAREAPRVLSRVTGPPEPPVSASDFEAGHFGEALKASDFIPIPAGKEVDLFGSDGYISPSWRGAVPGRYTVQFNYSTEERNPRPWLGTFQPDSLDGEWSACFRRVPRAELHAECVVDVQQR